MATKYRPDDYHTVTPFLTVRGAQEFMRFVSQVFGAQTSEMMRMPDGSIAHAEVRIGDSVIMLHDGDPMPAALYLYLPDVDATYREAIGAGATSDQAPTDQFWGDRQGAVRDRWGNLWFLATHKEDVPPEEMEKRMMAMAPPR